MDEPVIAFEPQFGPAQRPTGMRQAALPLLFGYGTFGQFWGIWVVVVADYLRYHRIGEGTLGMQMALLAIVSILTMTLFTPRMQSQPLFVTIPISLGTMAAGSLLVAVGSGPVLWVGMAVLGAGNGLVDVFLNVAAQALEREHRRPVLQWLHASYAGGGLSGAIIAGVLTNAGVPFQTILSLAVAMLCITVAWNAFAPGVRALPRSDRSLSRVSLSVFRRTPRLVLPAIVILFAFFVEGSMDVWSGAYLRNTLGSSALVAGLAFAAFSSALAVGRLTAGRVLFRLGYDRTIQMAGAGAFASGLVAALTGSVAVAGIGFLFLGFFISGAAPAAFGIVGETDENPSLAVSGMGTVGYAGFVVGPPIMGWLAESTSLRGTMVVIAGCTLGVLLGGVLDRVLRRARA